MAIEKMSLVSVAGLVNTLDDVINKCCEIGCFQVETSIDAVQDTQGHARVLVESNPYSVHTKRAYNIARNLGVDLYAVDYSALELNDISEYEEYTQKIETEIGDLADNKKKLSDKISELSEIKLQIEHLVGMKTDFSQLFKCENVKVRFGRIPTDSFPKLEYYSDQPFIFKAFNQDENHVWGVCFLPKNKADVVDQILESLYFERTIIPGYLQGNPQEALETLTNLIDIEQKALDDIDGRLEDISVEEEQKLRMLYSKLKALDSSFDMRRCASVIGNTFYIMGFVPKRLFETFAKGISSISGATAAEKEFDEMETEPPIKLRNNRIFRPFEMFVNMYGLPKYSGIDPTPYLAITYILLFGMMFGDVGQGLLISLFGLLLTKYKKAALGPIMTRIGLSSAFFGIFYGSVFGFESIIKPIFHHESVYKLLGYSEAPENIFQVAIYVLLIALGVGVALILISMLLNIKIAFKQKRLGDAVFGVNGIAGFLLYGSVIVGAALTMGLGIKVFNPVYVILLILLPALAIFLKHPLEAKVFKLHHDEKFTIGSIIGMGFLEMFESAISYLSNTVSFLRVGGFVLSHAGMMLVVAQLSGMNKEGATFGIGALFAYIIGNAIVIGIEGFLVSIQGLRLEFYEIFSRFYDGSGRPFEPLSIEFN